MLVKYVCCASVCVCACMYVWLYVFLMFIIILNLLLFLNFKVELKEKYVNMVLKKQTNEVTVL
jgi:hypothetical protein